jgi:hypothetical protein
LAGRFDQEDGLTSYQVVAPPGTDLRQSDPEEILRAITNWICSEPLRDLVAAFDGPALDADGFSADDLDRLLAFSAKTWDFRRGGERADARGPRYEETDTGRLILDVAAALDMVHSTEPAGRDYDHILILGGLLRTCLVRVRFTADLIAAHSPLAKGIAALGSSRPAIAVEAEHARRLELGEIKTEADAMDAAVRREFGKLGLSKVIAEERGGQDDGPSRPWWVRSYALDAGRQVHVLCAPSTDPARSRANTADTYTFWAERVVHLQPMSRVLIVTSSIHVPFQAADALRVLALPRRCQVEVVGVHQGLPYDGLLTTMSPLQYLQEINSALRSMQNLYEVLMSRDHEGSAQAR